MQRIVIAILAIILTIYPHISVAENTFIEVNRHTISDNFLSTFAVASVDEKYLFDISSHYEGALHTSTTLKVFTKVDGESYQETQALRIPDALSKSFSSISFLIYTEGYLVAIVDEINKTRTSHRFAIGQQGNLSYVDETVISWSKYNFSSKHYMLGDGKFYEYFNNTVSFWHVSEEGLLTHKFNFDYPIQADFSFHENFFVVVNNSSLVHIGTMLNLTDEKFFAEISQYDIDWDNNLVNELFTEVIDISEHFSRSYDRFVDVLVKDDISAVYLRTLKRDYIFKALGTEEASLAYINNNVANSLTTDQNSQQIFETGEVFKKVIIDWGNSQIIRNELDGVNIWGKIKFVSPNLLLQVDNYGKEGRLWQVKSNQNVSQVNIKVANDGDLPLDQQKKYLYDSSSHQLMVTGDANSLPGENDFKLYVWDYDLAQNDFTYTGSASCCSNENLSTGYNAVPLGIYGNNYYIAVNQGLGKKNIARFDNTAQGLALVQEFSLNGDDSQDLFVDEVFFADENTIVAELYGDSVSGLLLNICTLNGDGNITGCNRSTLFPEHEFGRNLTGYKFHKLPGVGKFIFAPTINESKMSNMFFVEFDGSEFIITQQYPLSKNGSFFSPVDTISSINQGQNLFVGNGGSLLHFERDNNQWLLSESNQLHAIGELTGYNNYYMDTNGRATVYDAESNMLWAVSGQVKNLSGWFKLTDDNKGFTVDISDKYRAITTFELTNAKPTIYKGGLINGSNYYATQDELFELDFSLFFINAESSLEVNAPEKFVLENGVLSATLTNADIIDGDYTDGRDISVAIYNNSAYIGYVNIIPVNVNDAPVLKVNITREYLKVNQLYEVNLHDYVSDPDGDNLIFQAASLPEGFSLEYSYIRGSSSKKGDYTINIVAQDRNGGEVSFNILITLNSTGVQESGDSKSSSSGGGSTGWLMFVLLLEIIRRSTKLKCK